MQATGRTSWCALRFFKSLASLKNIRSSSCCQDVSVSCQRNQSIQAKVKTNYVAVIGSGPAGFYTTQQLLKGDPHLKVDIFERLPVPFGLVRFGVAPDHPEVKNVINTFTNTASNDRCSFYGNVDIGSHVTLAELQDTYSAVVLSYGAAEDKRLGVPGENLPNVLSARSFVGWYNGLPSDQELPVNLDCESAVILGHGNVALDVARILLTPISILEKTDITENALEALRKSRIKTVYLVGRRGPLQVAFTIKELREMTRLPDTRTIIEPADVTGIDSVIKDLPRPRRRLMELIHKTAINPDQKDVKRWSEASREWQLMFLRSPLRILQSNSGDISGVEFAVNELQGGACDRQKAVPTSAKESIECGLVLRSIGYQSIPLESDLPFDAEKGIILNESSRVVGCKGLYCSGWVAQGPTGVILNTMTNGFETGKTILHDLKTGALQLTNEEKRSALMDRIQNFAVTFKDWEKIDMAETAAGERCGKPREKITSIPDMVKSAKS